jgi:hypothetical protein
MHFSCQAGQQLFFEEGVEQGTEGEPITVSARGGNSPVMNMGVI